MRLWRAIRWGIFGIVILAFSGTVEAFTFTHYTVSGTSMAPTFHTGDRVMVSSIGYGEDSIRVGHVVVIDHGDGTALLKRVVAVGPSRVSWDGCETFVEGVRLEEPWVDEVLAVTSGCGGTGSMQVPDGTVFVLGDHRGWSSDSRVFGPIDVDDIVGRVLFRFWTDETMRSF